MLKDVIAVVRSYNDPNIVPFCEKLIRSVDRIVVVVPSNLDGYQTKDWLAGLIRKEKVHLVPILVRSGNDWSAMLNAGLNYVRGLDATCEYGYGYILNLSNTTDFESGHLRNMRRAFDVEKAGQIGVVGTTFAGHLADGTPELLGTCYSNPRNTGMMIRREVFDAHPFLTSFDPQWDGSGGMEDYDFIGKMQVHTEFRAKMLNLQVPLRIGRHRDQAEYVKLMEGGLAAVDAYHKKMGWR